MLLSNDDGLFTFTTVFGCPEKLPWMENNINSILKTAQSNPHRMNHLHNERLDFFFSAKPSFIHVHVYH